MAISSPATFADRLNDELTRLAIAQFETPEFRLLFDTRLTLAGARFVAIQMTFYNVNRRDCWAYTQAKAPWAVKRTIWEHEKDELYFDPRGGADHRALMSKQALALGISAEQLAEAEPTPLVAAALMGWCHAAATLPWLGSLTLSHFLERRNNSELIPGGGFSKRMRDKLVNEVGIASDALVSSNVHVAADVDHSDSIWAVIAAGVTDEASYGVALEGARTSSILDRAFRAALAYGIKVIMDKINFPYRSGSHLSLLHVIAESGSWEKYGLDVHYNEKISSSRAHEGVLTGDVEFVGGNHVSPYGKRARGDKWVYLGQTVNICAGRALCVRADSGITGLAGLREKLVGTRGAHPHLNDWLQLKQNGLDVDRDEVQLVSQIEGVTELTMDSANPEAEENAAPLWQHVRDRTIDAAFVDGAARFIAEKEPTLNVIPLPDFPMILFTTVSSSLSFAEKHPAIVERFLKGMIEGIHFFKTQPERAAKIISSRNARGGPIPVDVAPLVQATLARALEPKLFPSPAAIANVYEEGVRADADAKRINPMELWDLHYIRQIADSGFVDDLYANSGKAVPAG